MRRSCLHCFCGLCSGTKDRESLPKEREQKHGHSIFARQEGDYSVCCPLNERSSTQQQHLVHWRGDLRNVPWFCCGGGGGGLDIAAVDPGSVPSAAFCKVQILCCTAGRTYLRVGWAALDGPGSPSVLSSWISKSSCKQNSRDWKRSH